MDGSTTYDPDDDSAAFNYTWSCMDSSGNACGVSLDSAVNTTIPAGDLSAGTYTFSLFAVKGDRNDTATATVVMTVSSTCTRPQGIHMCPLPSSLLTHHPFFGPFYPPLL